MKAIHRQALSKAEKFLDRQQHEIRRFLMATKAVTDASFQADVVDSDKPVLVDFWADWCGPCKMIAPALEEISDELADQVTIAKMDIMENPDIPGKLGVQGIPYLALYKNGEIAATLTGARPKSALKQWLEGEL
jgi:thioredoxin 1